MTIRWSETVRAPLLDVWAAMSDSERINRLGGLHLDFSFDVRADGSSQRTGLLRHLGMRVSWEEKPVVFTAPTHCVIDRVYDSGPISRSQFELNLTEIGPASTQLHYEGRFWPKSRLFAPAIKLDVEVTVRPKLDRAFRAIWAALEHNAALPDAAPPKLSAAAEKQVLAAVAHIAEPQVGAQLAAFLKSAPLPEQLRIQPLALAKRWRLPDKDVVAGMLRAVSLGLLQARWEIICPSCKGPANTAKRLDLSRDKAHCVACEVKYDANLADAVALTLRPVEAIRNQPERIDCMSSPSRMPHIVSQKVVPPRQEIDWTLSLLSGTYHVRGWPDLDQIVLTVKAGVDRRTANVLAGPSNLTPPTLRLGAGQITLRVRSKMEVPLKLVVERVVVAPHTLTVGRILEWPDVAELLPTDALEPGLHIAPYTGPLLAVQVSRGGEMADRKVGEIVRQAGARACQVSNGWVLATLDSFAAARAVAEQLEGALWQSAALGYGAVVELRNDDICVASGGALQELVAVAQTAEPGQWLLSNASRLTTAAAQAGFETGAGEVAVLGLTDRHASPLPLPSRPRSEVQKGDLIDGRFLLGDVVGQGGFGLVFAAEDKFAPSGAGSPHVVVKLLRAELADDASQVQRFFDEGRLAARLKGPHVVQVHEWGMAEDGRLFLAMERLTGRELGQMLQDLGTVDPVRALKLCAAALDGLQEAHEQGLIHRDIKPANLFVVGEDSPDETVKVIDFGIAVDMTGKVKAPEQAGAIIGTPIYMSPEQVRGMPLDGRTDLYSLGIVLYECLSGSLPFAGNTAMALLLARLTQNPAPIERVCAQPLPPGVPQVVDRALAHDVDQRPPDARAMAKALRELAEKAGNPVQWTATWRAHKSAAHRLRETLTAATEADLHAALLATDPEGHRAETGDKN